MRSRTGSRTDFTTLTLHGNAVQRSGEFLLAAAEAAHSSLNVAEIATDAERAYLDAQRAREALGTISKLLETIEFDLGLRRAIEAARDELHARLMSLEQRFSLQ